MFIGGPGPISLLELRREIGDIQGRESRHKAMLFSTQLDLKAIPDLVQNVFRIAPYSLWAKRFRDLHLLEDANPLLSDYFDRQFLIERAFERAHRYHAKTGRYPELDAAHYELYSFFAALKLTYERLSTRGQFRLRASIRDGLKDEKGLAPIAAEFHMATHLMRQGFDVEFTDLEGRQRYDLFASRGSLQIEIDCKAPSGDVGRKIHGQRFRVLANDLMPELKRFAADGWGYLFLVTIPGRLHGDDRTLEKNLAHQIAASLREPESPNELVTIRTFGLSDSPFNRPSISLESVAEFLENRFGLPNVHAACNWRPGGGAAILVIQSADDDRVVDGVYRQLRESAKSQFSGSLPAVLCVQLRDITGPQLRRLAREPANGLAAIATRLFSTNSRSHMACVSFVAPAGELNTARSIDGSVMRTIYEDIGAAYVFTNRNNPAAAQVDSIFRSRSG